MLVLPSLVNASGQVTWFRAYEPNANEFPESIAVHKQGNLFVSIATLRQIRKISPNGVETLFYEFPKGGYDAEQDRG